MTRTTANAIRSVIEEALRDDPRVILLGEHVGETSTALRAQFGEDRVRATPVADGATVALAVGLAIGGRRPVVELADGGRLPAVVEALADAGRLSRSGFEAPVVVRIPWGTEADGIDRPIGPWLDALDGVTVVAPSDPGQAAGLLRAALTSTSPTLLLEPRRLMSLVGSIPDGPAQATARILESGTDVTIAAWGTGVQPALAAAEALATEGISAEVLDLVALSPLDRTTLSASMQRTGRLVAVHDTDPTLADRIRAVGLETAFLYLEAPLASALAESSAVARAARDAATY